MGFQHEGATKQEDSAKLMESVIVGVASTWVDSQSTHEVSGALK